MAEQMYESSYRLTNVFSGEIVTEGAPRVDRQHLDASERLRVLARLRASGIPLEQGQKIVLYAPTWRGQSFHSPSNDAAALGQRVRRLRAQLPPDHIVLLKVHQQAYGFALEQPDLRDTLVPNEIPTNVVLGVTDVLVNDYSSVFFDFLSTGRPIIFFTPDLRDYEGYRGLYLAPDELPGPVVSRIPELARLVVAAGSGDPEDPLVSHREAYDTVRGRFAPKDDGHATERVIDIIFGGKRRGYDVRPARHDGRRRILIYLGGMRSNGITTSAINLLNNIDHDRFDVTAFYAEPDDLERRHNEARIDPRVRVFPRVGGIVPSKKDRWNRRRLQTIGVDAPRLDLDSMRAVFGQEWRRCFGEARFDHVIDYSGYASYWAFLLLPAPARSRSIWLHSDLRSDQMREVDGHRPHEANLRAVFSMYPAFDHLVSVSPALCRMNATNLSDVVAKEKHTWARNSINVEQILRLGRGVDAVDHGRPPAVVLPNTLSEAMSALAQRYGIEGLVAEVERLQIVDRFARGEPGAFTFVTVGRLSPEKNDDRLIEAFDLVRQEHPLARLVIVGGGPMLDGLKTRVDRLGLSEVVTIAGQQANPYAIMAQCDCFVLSSDYEGHPMVFLEARVLGLPIVSTDFPSVNGALPEGAGLVVSRDTQALAAGMRSALAGEVPTKPFDAAAYNAEVIAEFYSAIGARS
jgi:glycosyltransferase involved in cell wall biosynthesis